jgi:hypothetical protein
MKTKELSKTRKIKFLRGIIKKHNNPIVNGRLINGFCNQLGNFFRDNQTIGLNWIDGYETKIFKKVFPELYDLKKKRTSRGDYWFENWDERIKHAKRILKQLESKKK